jgi:hypothetical protein
VEGRGVVWTLLTNPGRVHQITPLTAADRYPELFDLAAELAPCANRLLSFGCSTGEEIVALRSRFPEAGIVGAEINGRSRRIAAQRVADDRLSIIMHPRSVRGTFDLVFALAVLQREPDRVVALDVQDISPFYPFARFDAAVQMLVESLRVGGLLCVVNAQYRVEDSSAAAQLEPIAATVQPRAPIFAADGRRTCQPIIPAVFRKLAEPVKPGS